MRLLHLAAVLAASGALAAAAAGAASPNGLFGVVTKGPTQPVCRVGEPCTAPVQVTLVFSRPGHPALRRRSAANGAYRIALPPGYYTVRSVEKIGFSQTPRPAKVHVRTGHWDKLNFAFGTGIR